MEIKKFLGLKNTTSAERYKPGQLEIAQNVDLDDSFKLLTRLGSTTVDSGPYHSLWSDGDMCLAMNGQDLYRVEADLSRTFLKRLSSAARVAYSRQGGVVYFSNGVDTGRVYSGGVGEWGVRAPTAQPAVVAGAGLLQPGRYLYALTYQRASGAESAPGRVGMFELAAQGGLQFSAIPSSSDPEVVRKSLYLSGTNGQELFRLASIPSSAAAYAYLGDGTDLGRRLDTEYTTVAPPASILEAHAGVMYAARGGTVYHSAPFELERFHTARWFLQFPGTVRLMAAVNDGMYLANDEHTWFVAGTDPRQMKPAMVLHDGAIAGTAVKTIIGELTDDGVGEGDPGGVAVLWASPAGVMIGIDGGKVLNLTVQDFGFPGAQRGSAVLRQTRGIIQYLATLQGTGLAANSYS